MFNAALALAVFAGFGGYGGPDSTFALISSGVAIAAGAAFLAGASRLARARGRLYAFYGDLGAVTPEALRRSRVWTIGVVSAIGGAVSLLVAVLGFAPWWAMLLYGLVGFIPIGYLMPDRVVVSGPGG